MILIGVIYWFLVFNVFFIIKIGYFIVILGVDEVCFVGFYEVFLLVLKCFIFRGKGLVFWILLKM